MKKVASSTIVAVSSPEGPALRGILRISGPEAFEKAQSLLPGERLPRKFSVQPREVQLPHLPPFPSLLFLMPSPRSYTTEDMVEFHLPGSPLLLQEVLEYFLSQNVSLAPPGEFTKRAFLKGRINLLQAEAVLGLIESSSRTELQKIQLFLKGKVGQDLERCANLLKEILAEIHAFVDFPDYDVEPEEGAFSHKIREALKILEDLRGKMKREGSSKGPTVALWGGPNTGKSHLFNSLIGEEKAIVSERPCSTRDVLSDQISWKGKEYLLLDLPCFGTPQDEIERLSQERSLQKFEEADLILLVLDGTRGLNPQEEEELAKLSTSGRAFFVLKNKGDLPSSRGNLPFSLEVLPLSAKEKTGLNELREKIDSFFGEGSSGEVFFNHRQIEVYQKGKEALQRALEMDESSADLMAIEVEEAMEAVGHLTGEVVTEEILDIIFARFCIGK